MNRFRASAAIDTVSTGITSPSLKQKQPPQNAEVVGWHCSRLGACGDPSRRAADVRGGGVGGLMVVRSLLFVYEFRVGGVAVRFGAGRVEPRRQRLVVRSRHLLIDRRQCVPFRLCLARHDYSPVSGSSGASSMDRASDMFTSFRASSTSLLKC